MKLSPFHNNLRKVCARLGGSPYRPKTVVAFLCGIAGGSGTFLLFIAMGHSGQHYEQAFEQYLRVCRVPFVSVEQARRVLAGGAEPGAWRSGSDGLKSFDCVVYGEQENLLLEVKGRRIAPRKGRSVKSSASQASAEGTPITIGTPPPPGRLECWTTMADLTSLQQWEQKFGKPFVAAIVFVYWCEGEPPGALYQEVFEYRKRWYALRAIRVSDYVRAMRVRSPKWGTVDLAPAEFEKLSQPFAPATPYPLKRMGNVDVGRGILGRAREGLE